MKKYLLLLAVVLMLLGCKNKKTSLKDDDAVEINEFVDFFPEVSLPFVVSDTVLLKKQTDSALIGYMIFTQFVPDTLLTRDFGKDTKPKFYPLGRATEKGKETYLFIKAAHGGKRVGYLACFDKDNKFLNGMPIVRTGFDNSTSAYGSLDKKFLITTYRERKKSSEEITYKRNVFMYNNATNSFTLIMTEPNEEMIENVVNPIDTFPKKNKFSGEYVRDKKNFLSVRDGKKPSEMIFFVHFEGNKGECNGELKGNARFISTNIAQYKDNGNPCTLEFTFGKNAVVMKEIAGCGSYRDIKCFFEGTFPRKKEIKPKPDRTKK